MPRSTALAPHRRRLPILTVPGIDNSGPRHWQTRWEQELPECRRVELGSWDRPHRNTWVNALNLAVREAARPVGAGHGGAPRPVLLAAHSLGCLAVAWWASLEGAGVADLVAGALLVAPPEVDFFPRDERLSGFAPVPVASLPFPSVVVASRDDPWVSWRTAERMARQWGSGFVDLGEQGHINADSDLGSWTYGQDLLAGLARPGGGRLNSNRLGAIEDRPNSNKLGAIEDRPNSNKLGAIEDRAGADGVPRDAHAHGIPSAARAPRSAREV